MKPVISLHGNGEDVVLSNRAARFVLMRGATGLGWSPRDLTVADLASGGGVLRHVRATTPKVMIPLLLGGGYGERREDRRRLERLCDGRVEIRVVHPDGQARSRFGWLESGLHGDYGAGEDALDGQKLALTFVCPDPLWYGVVRDAVVRVSAARKAFITGSAPQVQRRNVFPNPNTVGLYGVMYNSSRAELGNVSDGGESAIRVTRYQPPVVFPDSSPDIDFNAPAGVFLTMSFDVRSDTVDEITVWAGNNSTVEEIGPDWRRVTLSGLSSPSNLAHRFGAYFRSEAAIGDWFDIRRVLVEETEEPGEFFSGDTPDTSDTEYRWEGEPGRSPSVEDARGAAHAIPFFPVMLSDSTVQGAHVLTIQGDAEAWPVWEVTGPGEDLLIQNDETGDRIFIQGKIGETITITTQPQIQDITSNSEGRGALWSRVSEDSVFFPLKPGINRIRMSMVNSKPESTVTLKYREAFKAGM